MNRVRFIAPPSGPLLVTGARAALANAAFAHASPRGPRGHVTLRIAEQDDRILPDLRFLGFTWDAIGEPGDHQAAIAHLKAIGRLYPCFEGEVELNAKRDHRLRRGQPATYDRAMLKMTPEQRAAAEAGGKVPYWRFKLANRVVNWVDPILGRREAKLPAISDPVLVTAEGAPSALLAAIVDDIAQGITHVIRADEGDSTTGIQIDVLSALGQNPDATTFAHLPPLAETGRLAIRALRHDGVDSAALVAWLGLDGPFAWRRLRDKPDPTALPPLNRAALARRSFQEVADRLPPGATEPFWLAIRGHIDLLTEARHWWEVVSEAIFPEIPDGAGRVIQTARAALPEEPWDGTTWSTWLAALPLDKADTATLRHLLTGEDDGPDMAALLPLIGRARVLERLRAT
jgi:glutamyl-tRNA synthetase